MIFLKNFKYLSALLFLIGFITQSAPAADFNQENIDFAFKNSDGLTILSNQEIDETKAGWIWSAYKKSNKLYRFELLNYNLIHSMMINY